MNNQKLALEWDVVACTSNLSTQQVGEEGSTVLGHPKPHSEFWVAFCPVSKQRTTTTTTKKLDIFEFSTKYYCVKNNFKIDFAFQMNVESFQDVSRVLIYKD